MGIAQLLTHAYVHRLADVHLAGFAPAFTLSFHDSECSRKPPVPIASVVGSNIKKKMRQPQFLHKFCSVDRALQILKDKTVYLPKPNLMNDPFEFTAQIEIPTDKNKREKIAKHFLTVKLGIPQEKLTQDKINESVSSEHFFKLISLEIIGQLEILKANSGMTCFCETYKNKLLWAHYADEYKGVCLVFNNLNGNNEIIERSLPLSYSEEKSKLDMYNYFFNHNQFIRDTIQVILTKSSEWEYEREWRYIKPSLKPLTNEERLINFPEDGLKKIILGPRIDNLKRKQILDEVFKQNYFIVVQSYISLTNPELEFKIIPKGFDYKDEYSWYDLKSSGTEPSLLNNLFSKEDIEKLSKHFNNQNKQKG